MVAFDVIGAWADNSMTRAEVVTASRQMLMTMPEYPAGRWTRFIENQTGDFMDAVPVDIADTASLSGAIEDTNRRGGAYTLRIERQAGPENYPIQARVHAGAHSNKRIVIKIGVPDRDSGPLSQLIGDYMIAIVSAWQPDWLKVGTYEFHVAQRDIGLTPKQIVLGWRTYLAGRVPLDTEMLGGTVEVTPTSDGGRYVTLGGSLLEPSLDQARLVRTALGYS